MQALSAASNFVIKDSTFVEFQNNFSEGSTALRALFEASLPDAVHNSRTQEVIAKPLPTASYGAIVDEITAQVRRTRNSSFVVMQGGPGYNLAHLTAQRLEDQLAASFFFSKKHRVEDPRQFFTTISYQLALVFPEYREALEKRLSRDPSLITKRLEIQFQELIAKPFQHFIAWRDGLETRRFILVYGLDECKDLRDRREILRIISGSKREFPLQRLVFSRFPVVERQWGLLDSKLPKDLEFISIDCDDWSGTMAVVGMLLNFLSRAEKRERVYIFILRLAASLFDQPTM